MAMGRVAGHHRGVDHRDAGSAVMVKAGDRRRVSPMTAGQTPMMAGREWAIVAMVAIMVMDGRHQMMVAMMVMDMLAMGAGYHRRRQGDGDHRGAGGQQSLECAGHRVVPSANAEIRRLAPATASTLLA